MYIHPLIEKQANIMEASRPLEGDLIWFPLDDRLFEIKFVEHQKPWFQLQKNYVYELRCELFEYEDEKIDTGIEDIDDNVVSKPIILVVLDLMVVVAVDLLETNSNSTLLVEMILMM